MMPVTVVFGMFVHVFCCGHNPVHGGVAHTFAAPPAPQISPVAQLPQSGVMPPQPSAIAPHSTPLHVRGTHAPLPLPPPHANNVPSPPQKSGGVHVPHSITPPQPSPIGPHVACSVSHDANPHGGVSMIASQPPAMNG